MLCEQLPEAIQARLNELMSKNSQAILMREEQIELDALMDRALQLMLRKVEATALLRKRGCIRKELKLGKLIFLE